MSIVLYDAIGRAVILPAGMKLEWGWHSWGGGMAGPALRVGLSLSDVANRVQVIYTYEDAAGSLVDAETAWATHAQSVARYGTMELRHTLSDPTATAAAGLR